MEHISSKKVNKVFSHKKGIFRKFCMVGSRIGKGDFLCPDSVGRSESAKVFFFFERLSLVFAFFGLIFSDFSVKQPKRRLLFI